jgi:hypothetical protein
MLDNQEEEIMKKVTKWESYEDAKKRIEAEQAKKEETQKEIMKQLRDPNIPAEKKDELVEKLYEGIEIKNQKQ